MGSPQNLTSEFRHLLNCPVCYQQYDLPKRLSCEHVFCSSCLQKLLQDGGVIKCPECRFVTIPSPPTINSLPNCIIIQRFLEELTKNNNNNEKEQCDITNKNYSFFDDTSENLETPINPNAIKLKNSIQLNYQPVIEHLKEQKRKIEENLNSVRNSIDYVTHELIKGVQARRLQLMEEVDCYQSRWLKPLDCQIDSLEMEVHEQISLVSFYETNGNSYKLNLRTPLELSNIMNAFECRKLSFNDTGALQCVLDEVSSLGNVLEVQKSVSLNSTDETKTDVAPVLNKQSHLHGNFGPRGMCVLSDLDETLMVVDSGNRLCYKVSPAGIVRTFPLNNGDRPNASFIDVTIINHGETLIFSDYSSPILKTFDTEFNELAPIDLQIGSSPQLRPTPFSLTSDRRGYIYVTDKRNRVIQARKESGELVREFQCHGTPGYIANWNDLLAVSDAGNKCCYIYSVDGRLLSTIDQQTDVNFKMPMGVAFHEKGFIFIADYLKTCVSVFTISGQMCFDIDLSNYKINPECITVHKDTVYVSDRLNRNIVKINLSNFPPKL